MKSFVKKIIIICLSISFLIVGYFLNIPRPVNIKDVYQSNQVGQIIEEPFKASTRGVLGMKSVAENNFLELFINEKTTHFAVVDKRNNALWTSNFTISDNTATRTYRNMQRSTFTISYRDIDNTTRLWTNFDYSINSENFEIDYDSIENGIKINYTLADVTPKGYWFPNRISKERYQSLVLDPFNAYDFESDNDKERSEFTYYLRNAYVESVEDPNILRLGIVTGDNTASDLAGIDVGYLFEFMYEIGLYGNVLDQSGEKTGEYSFDDVNFDNQEHGFSIEIRDPEFKIPLVIQLKEDHVHAEILTDEITKREPFEIVSIRMLPYFGATRTTDNGYMIIPEGSGGLMYLNNGKTQQRSYSTHFYEPDLNVISNRLSMRDIGAHMPIFGTKKDQSALLGIITEGAEHATLTTEVSGKNDVFNKSFVEFRFKDSGLYFLTQAGIPIWHHETYTFHPTIRYYILAGEEATYSDMAKLYGKYLDVAYNLKVKDNIKASLYLDILGAFDFEDYFLFIPYKNTQSLTTYNQALSIIQSLEKEGIDHMVINYLGWFNKGINHESPTSIDIDRVLGSKRSFNAFNQYLSDQGHNGYFDVDFIKNYDISSVFSNRDISRVVGGTLAELYPYDIASGLENKSQDPYYLSKVGKINRDVNSFMNQFNRLSAQGVSLRNFGQLIYSDFHNNHSRYRYEIKNDYQDIVYRIASDKAVMIQNPHDFLLPFISHLSDLSIESSKFLMVDASIPFYQLAIAGKMSYAMPSINLDQIYDLDYYLLKAIETGSNIKFTITSENSSLLISTKYNGYFSTEFQRLSSQIVDITKRFQNLESANAYLISHEIMDNHRVRVKYSNGVTYILDYNNLTYES